MAEIQAVVFDFDGVIVDTEPISQKAWNKALDEFDNTSQILFSH